MAEILEKNRKADIDYNAEIWKEISPNALDLVVKMTEFDQYNRPSAKECLSHPWFSEKHFAKNILKDVGENLRSLKIEHLKERDIKMDGELGPSTPILMKRSLSNSKSRISANDVEDCELHNANNNGSRRGSYLGVFSFLLNKLKPGLERTSETKLTKTCNNLNPFFKDFVPLEESKNLTKQSSSNSISEEECIDEMPQTSSTSFNPESNEIRTIPCITGDEGVSKKIFNKHSKLILYYRAAFYFSKKF